MDNETCKSDRKRISMLENELQLANQREMITREMEERSNWRERETHQLYVEAREKLKRVRESERLYKVALVLSWLFFIFVMLLLCFASMNNNVRVRNLNLPWCLGGNVEKWLGNWNTKSLIIVSISWNGKCCFCANVL